MILFIEPVSKNYGNFVPTFCLPLMEIGSFVKKQIPEIEIKIISMAMDYGLPLTPAGKEQIYRELLQDLSDMKPKAIGISCTSIAQGEETVKLCEFIKEYDPDIFLFLGGYFPTIYYEEIFRQTDAVDLIVTGEGEVPALMIIERLRRGLDPRDEQIPNLAWKKNREIHLTRQGVGFDLRKKALLDLSLLKDPDVYGILPYSLSRGCSHQCNYCLEGFIRPVRKEVPYEIIRRDLENLSRRSHADSIWMCDPLFKSFNIASVLKKMHMKIFFETRSDVLEPSIVPSLRDICSSLAIGFESASYHTLKRMNKVKTFSQYQKYIGNMEAIFQQAKRNGIPIVVFFIAGYPGDTLEDLEESLVFVKKLSRYGGSGGHFFKIGECRAYPYTNTYNKILSSPDVIFDNDGVFGENVVRQPSSNLDFETILFYMNEIFRFSDYTYQTHEVAQKMAPLIRLPLQALSDNMIPAKCYHGNDRDILCVNNESLSAFTGVGMSLREKYKEYMAGEKTTRYLPI